MRSVFTFYTPNAKGFLTLFCQDERRRQVNAARPHVDFGRGWTKTGLLNDLGKNAETAPEEIRTARFLDTASIKGFDGGDGQGF
jgi:hypothetical protein